MAVTNIVDPQGILRVVDTESNKNLTTTGGEDLDKSDFLKITANGSAVNSTDRLVTLTVGNDNAASTATNVHAKINGKGKSLLYLGTFAQAADLPTNASEYYGALAVVNVAGVYKLYISTTAGWVVVGTQS
jgi:hypothetical protein